MEIKITIDDRLVRGVKKIFSRRVLPFLLAVMLSGVTVALLAEPFVIPYVFKSGEVISSSQMNANFADLQTRINEMQAQLDSLVDLSGESLWELNAGDYYYNGGDVGIGTDVPGARLEVESDDGVTDGGHILARVFRGRGVGEDAGVGIGYYAGGSNETGGYLRAEDNLPLMLGTMGAEQSLTISNTGNVGVGTTAPGQKLHVNGNVRAARFEDTTSSYYVDPASSTSAVLNGTIDAPLMMTKVYTVDLNDGYGTFNTGQSTSTWFAFVGGISDAMNASVSRRRYWVYDVGSNGTWDIIVDYQASANVNVRVRVLFIKSELFRNSDGNVGPA
jgi:hypothetical protein